MGGFSGDRGSAPVSVKPWDASAANSGDGVGGREAVTVCEGEPKRTCGGSTPWGGENPRGERSAVVTLNRVDSADRFTRGQRPWSRERYRLPRPRSWSIRRRFPSPRTGDVQTDGERQEGMPGYDEWLGSGERGRNPWRVNPTSVACLKMAGRWGEE